MAENAREPQNKLKPKWKYGQEKRFFPSLTWLLFFIFWQPLTRTFASECSPLFFRFLCFFIFFVFSFFVSAFSPVCINHNYANLRLGGLAVGLFAQFSTFYSTVNFRARFRFPFLPFALFLAFLQRISPFTANVRKTFLCNLFKLRLASSAIFVSLIALADEENSLRVGEELKVREMRL